MKKLLFWNGVVSLLAGYVMVMRFPVLVPPHAIAANANAESIEKEIDYARASKDISEILARYHCGDDIRSLVSRSAVDYGVPSRLLAAQMVVESSCRSTIVSKAGAVGLLQVMPNIWGYARRDLQDPEYNVRAGTHILAANIRRYGQRDGLRHYFGVTEDSTASDEYADKVIQVARK